MKKEDDSLTIFGVAERDQGSYTCIASTELDQDLAKAHLTVLGNCPAHSRSDSPRSPPLPEARETVGPGRLPRPCLWSAGWLDTVTSCHLIYGLGSFSFQNELSWTPYLLSAITNPPKSSAEGFLSKRGKVERGVLLVIIFTDFIATSLPPHQLKQPIIEARLDFDFILPTPSASLPPPLTCSRFLWDFTGRSARSKMIPLPPALCPGQTVNTKPS